MTRRDLDDPEEKAAALGDLEALLFAAARPLSLAEIARRLYLEEPRAAELVDLLDQELSRPERGLQLREAGAKWRLETRPDREDIVAGLRAERGARPLTGQALETLAVVALRQPVTTEEVSAIRGAESYGTIETLRRQRLIARAEQRTAEGRAARWRTTQHFLDQFGLANLEELYREGRIQKLFGSSLRSTQDSEERSYPQA
jgi:segregation and condensation protein B